MNNKNLLRLLLVIIIIILILCIVLLNIGKSQKDDISSNNVEIEKDVIILLEENVIIPKNSYLFFGEYVKGEIETQEIYNTIYYFSNIIIPKYYSELKGKNEKEISDYYEKNENKIKELMDIEKKEEFVDFIKNINAFDADKLELEQIEFINNTITPKKDYTEAIIKFSYKGESNLKLNIKVFKKIQKLNKNIVFNYNY